MKTFWMSLWVFVMVCFCGCKRDSELVGAGKLYTVPKATEPLTLDANWDKPFWRAIPPLTLDEFMGDRPAHFPLTQAKLAWDEQYVYVIFRVEDRFVRAVATETHQFVCLDSCVEFFFTPQPTTETGYFNLEMNCIGTILLYHQTARGENQRTIDPADVATIQVATSLPKGVAIEAEITAPQVWTVEYAIPLAMLGKYAPVKKPAAGVRWRANFYKCADQTSAPHWLTWNRVDRPKPDFHRPEYFGVLEFVE